MGIRVAIVDDNPHLAWDGRVYPANATFQQFAAALLDLPGSPVDSIVSCVPLRAADVAPLTRPLDPRIEVVGTAPFDGIAGYLRHAPAMLRSNRRVLTPAIAAADLIWLKVPASNAPLATAIAIRSGTPRFVWVAGSAADVAAGRYAGIGGLGARTVGLAYDLAGRLAAVGGRRIVVGKGVADRDGIVSSLIEADEVRDPGDRTWPPIAMPMRFAWAGRLVEGKGLEALLAAVLREPGVVLDILGDGPARGRLAEHVRAEGDWDRVTWAGHIADRSVYLDRLAGADAFVFPSPAEGFPKVVLDALAVGLPVIATRAGGLADLADSGLIEPIGGPGPEAILTAWRRLLETESQALAERRRRGVAYAADHTRPAEAARLVARWQGWWPALPWLG